MTKPRPFLVGMLCGSMTLSPVSWAMAQQPAEATDAIVVQSGGIDALLVDKKDAGLKRALMMLDDRLLELPAELQEDDMPAGMIKMVWDHLISPMSLRFGMDENPAEGAMPFHAQLIVNTIEAGQPRSTAGMLASMLEQQGAEWSSPAGGIQTTEAPFGKMMLGAPEINGKESFVVGVNALNLNAPALDVSSLLPKGVAPGFAVHADMKQLTPLMEMAFEGNPDMAMVRDLMESSGIMGENAMTMDMAIGHGADRTYGGLIMRNYAKAGANWGALPGKNIPASFLSAIPADATYAQAGMYDWSKLPTMLREFAKQAGEEQDPFEIMAEELGFNPDTDFIAHLGDHYTIYQSDTTGGGGLLSMVAVMSLKDPAAFARTHNMIKTKINQLGAREGRGYVKINSWSEGGIDAFTLMTPGLPLPVEISWAIVGNYVVAGASPTALWSAASQLRDPKSSILDNKKVVEMAGGRLDNVMAFEFIDTPRHARQGYGVAQALASVIANAVRSPSDPSRDPGPIMMPFNEFVKDIQPMVVTGRWQGEDLMYAWQGDRSMMVNIAGAGGAMGGLMGIAVAAGMVGALLPALAKARESAKQVKSSTQARSVAMGVAVWCADHNDKLPDSLDTLLNNDLITADMLVSPFGPAWDGAGDFGYRTDLAGKSMASIQHPGQTIIAIDRAMLLNQGDTSVAFLDGHVEYLSSYELSEYLEMDWNQGGMDSLGIPDWMRP
ncbi:MAG: hypothetical protein H6812_08850 [Phycisphaeraceae bacterium]|nr:hypothetical protein [Phycisphaerales bacterium]MCB9843349.1 hypothetical protein [Phycisphaeraceae bacterium]